MSIPPYGRIALPLCLAGLVASAWLTAWPTAWLTAGVLDAPQPREHAGESSPLHVSADGATASGEGAVHAAAARHVEQLVHARQLPATAAAAWTGAVHVAGTDYHRFALRVADSVNVLGAGLVVSVEQDGTIGVAAINTGDVPATLYLSTGVADTRRVLSTIGTHESRPVWHGSVVDVTKDVPVPVDRWTVAGQAFGVNRNTGLIERMQATAGHGAYLAKVEPSLSTRFVRPAAGTPGRSATQRPLRGSDETTVVGSGLVYKSDPRAGSPELLPLPGLLGDGSRLAGEYVSVSSRIFDPDGEPTPSSGASGQFVYEPVLQSDPNCVLYEEDCSLIDNVNAYHHIDRFIRNYWTSRLGVDINFATTVWTHTSQTGSVVHGDTIRLGSGGLFLHNNALEDDILYHEYAHVALRHVGFVSDVFSTTQHRALGEGYADYFALSYLDRPRFADWATRCPPRYECEGPEDATEIRTLATNPSEWNWNYGVPSVQLKYGVCTRKHLEDLKCKTSWMTFDETYVWGMIWGSTLWDIREALGPAATDELVIGSIVRTGGQASTFTTASGAILFADREINGGANEATLRAIFTARGITPFLSSATGTDEGTESTRGSGQPDRADVILDTYPNPFREAFQASVEVGPGVGDTGSAQLTVFDANGRVVRRVAIPAARGGLSRIDVDLSGAAAGTYVVVARVGDNVATRSITRIR